MKTPNIEKKRMIVIDTSSPSIMYYTDGSGIRYEYEYTEKNIIFHKFGKYFRIKQFIIYDINTITY